MSKYKTFAMAAGIGLIALGVYNFKDCRSLRDNPHLTPEVAGILELQRDKETFGKQYMQDYNSRPDYSRVWSFDDKSGELLKKLNEPIEIKQKLLKELWESYDKESDRRTMTNKTWQNYCTWNRETKANNKSNSLFGLLASLSGLGLLALSRKN